MDGRTDRATDGAKSGLQSRIARDWKSLYEASEGQAEWSPNKTTVYRSYEGLPETSVLDSTHIVMKRTMEHR